MEAESHQVNESIREMDGGDSWVISNKFLLSRESLPPPEQPCWSDGGGSFFVLSELAGFIPESRPLSPAGEIQKVYDAGNASAVWRAGEAFIKIKKVIVPDATREHVTLDHLHSKGPLGFDIPHVHFHDEFDDRYYIVLSQIPGPTLAEAWPTMDEATKQLFVDRVVTICEQLAAWESDTISGVDSRQLSDRFLSKTREVNCEPQHLIECCQEVGMDCSSFVFYHCDLGPGNIIVKSIDGSIGVLDWETAGFVPREWITTKFRISSGMDLPADDMDGRVDWRRRVSRRLIAKGHPDVLDGWWKRFTAK